jgi:hypothetical protein
MSQTKISTISNFIDKLDISKIINKIDFIKNCATGIGLFTFISCLITFEHYRKNVNQNDEFNKKINANKCNNKIHENKLDELIKSNVKILQMLEKHEKILDNILQNPLLNLSNKETLTNCSSSLSSLSSLIIRCESEQEENQVDDYLNYYTDEPNQELIHEIEKPNHEPINEIVESNEDIELLNECYDSFPCNNSKKISSLNKLFNWN